LPHYAANHGNAYEVHPHLEATEQTPYQGIQD